MGTPIISPWFFYLADLFNSLIGISIVILFSAIAIGALTWFNAVESDLEKEEYTAAYNKYGKKCIFAIIISAILLTFLPSEQTCIKMLLADNITYERLELVGTSIQDIYEDIIAIAEKAVGSETAN